MRTTVRVEGFRELQEALSELPKATSKNTVRRAMTKALTPLKNQAAALAPNLSGELSDSLAVSNKLSGRQQAVHKADIGAQTVQTAEGFRSTPQTVVFMFVGPKGSAKSIVQEFGSVNQSPHPYMRPAWDSNAMPMLNSIADDLWSEIEKSRARLARKAAKALT
jgi:HK97 gp10 family phage protein